MYEKEHLAILLAVEHWRQYLQLGEFVIQTDHRSLTSLTEQRLHTNWQQKALTKMMGLQYRIVYKKGSENNAADSLSRRPHATAELQTISSVQPAWLSEIMASYSADTFCQNLLQKLAADPAADARYSLKNGLLCIDNCIWVGADSHLQTKLVWPSMNLLWVVILVSQSRSEGFVSCFGGQL